MNEPGQTSDSSNGAGIEELRGEMQAMQGTLSFALVLMFIFTVCVNIFLYRQAAERTMEARNIQGMVNAYMTTGEGQARDFWFKLNTYASTHPDFAPVYGKWSQIITIHSNAPVGLTAPVKK